MPSTNIEELVDGIMTMTGWPRERARERAMRLLATDSLIELGTLGPVETRILVRVLREDYSVRERWHRQRPRLLSRAEYDLAEEERLVLGMLLERLPDDTCRHCGLTHAVVPDDLCSVGRLEYDAAGAIEQAIGV